MTANHTPGCPALIDPRDGCACLLRGVAAQGDAPHDDPCDCDDCRLRAVDVLARLGHDAHYAECNDFAPNTIYCICDRLRACEARALADFLTIIDEDDPVYLRGRNDGYDKAMNEIPAIAVYGERLRSEGYHAALDAARDAVDALLGKTVPPSDGVTEALAAIDALEKP